MTDGDQSAMEYTANDMPTEGTQQAAHDEPRPAPKRKKRIHNIDPHWAVAAKRVGMDPHEYIARRKRGDLWCGVGRHMAPGADCRRFGTLNACLACRPVRPHWREDPPEAPGYYWAEHDHRGVELVRYLDSGAVERVEGGGEPETYHSYLTWRYPALRPPRAPAPGPTTIDGVEPEPANIHPTTSPSSDGCPSTGNPSRSVTLTKHAD